MCNVDFTAIAAYCIKRYISKLDGSRQHYLRTLYVCISENDEVWYSTAPHILQNPKTYKCLLIHQREDLAITNWHKFYDVEFIDSLGGITDGILGDGFKITGAGADPHISLKLWYKNKELYSCTSPHEDHLQKMWDLYNEIRNLNYESISEIQKIVDEKAKIEEAKRRIQELTYNIKTIEEERDHYLKLIEVIREVVKK